MEVVIKKGGKKRKHLFIKNEEIKLENEVVILKIVFGMVHGWPYEGLQKLPHIQGFITHHHWNIFVKMLIIKYSQITIQSLHLEWFDDIPNYGGKKLSTQSCRKCKQFLKVENLIIKLNGLKFFFCTTKLK